MLTPHLPLLARLLSCVLLAATAALARAVPEPPPTSWTQVEQASGEVAYLRLLTAFALTANEADFSPAWAAVSDPATRRNSRAKDPLANAFCRRFPDAALRLHRARPTDPDLALFRIYLFSSLAQRDPAAARAELDALPPGPVRDAAFTHVVHALTTSFPEAALSLVLDTNQATAENTQNIFAALARHDPHAALAAIDRIPELLRLAARHSIFQVWAASDSDAALDWINRDPTSVFSDPSQSRAPMAELLLSQHLSSNFEFPIVRTLASRAAHPDLRAAALRELNLRIFNRPPEELWNHLQSFGWECLDAPHESYRPRHHRLAGAVLRAERLPPDQAKVIFAQLATRIQPGSIDAAEFLAVAWTPLAPEDALAWALGTPQGSFHNTLFHVAFMLVEIDSALAFRLAAATPAGSRRDDINTAIASALAQKDVAAALAWVSTFPPESPRESALFAIAWIASHFDPPGMIAALEALPAGKFRDQAAAAFARLPPYSAGPLPAPGSASLPFAVTLRRVPTPAALDETLSAIIKTNDYVQRLHLLASWVDTHPAPLDIVGQLRLLENRSPAYRELHDLLILKLGERHPEVTDLARHVSDAALPPRIRPSSLRSSRYFIQLADTDPAAALAKIAATPMLSDDRQRVFADVLADIASRDPRRAFELLAGARQINRTQARDAIIYAWARQHPAEAIAWLRALPPTSHTTSLVESLLRRHPNS